MYHTKRAFPHISRNTQPPKHLHNTAKGCVRPTGHSGGGRNVLWVVSGGNELHDLHRNFSAYLQVVVSERIWYLLRVGEVYVDSGDRTYEANKHERLEIQGRGPRVINTTASVDPHILICVRYVRVIGLTSLHEKATEANWWVKRLGG